MNYPPFMSAICRGSYALGTACGHCPRCAAERLSMGAVGMPQSLGASSDAKLREALEAIRRITIQTWRDRPYTALSEIDQIARKALAP